MGNVGVWDLGEEITLISHYIYKGTVNNILLSELSHENTEYDSWFLFSTSVNVIYPCDDSNSCK